MVWRIKFKFWAHFMALLSAEFCVLGHDSLLDMLALNFCASLVSVECRVCMRTRPKFAANP